ncbi:MAG: hypothetical protein ACRC2J_07125 [Microcoleaceae cyanobacterium]
MFLIKKQPIFLYQLILISNLLLACGVNKTSYCNQIILNINEANSLVNQNKNLADPVATEQLTKQLDEVVKKLDKIKPRDEQLREFVVAIMRDFQKLSQGFTTISKTLEIAKKSPASVAGRNQLEQAKSQINSTTKTMNDLAKKQENLTNELIAYCQK